MDSREVFVVGITGGMGCGQSTVAKVFEKRGAKALNADAIGHQVLDRDEGAKKEIRNTFGNKVFFKDGKINRKALGEVAFVNKGLTHELNRIVHPRMVSRIVDRLEQARDNGKYPIIAIDAALIFEINMEQIFDRIVVVTAQMRHRIARIVERDGLSEKEIRDRIRQQLPIEEKVKWADFTIHNNGTLEQVTHKAEGVYKRLLKQREEMAPRLKSR